MFGNYSGYVEIWRGKSEIFKVIQFLLVKGVGKSLEIADNNSETGTCCDKKGQDHGNILVQGYQDKDKVTFLDKGNDYHDDM